MRRLSVLCSPSFGNLPPLGVECGRGHHWKQDTIATTKLSPEALEAHYEKQLEDQGWTRLDGHVTPMMAWSLWSVPYKEKAQGFIYVLQGPDEQTRYLFARVDIDTDSFWASHGGHSTIFRTSVGRRASTDTSSEAAQAHDTEEQE